MRLEDIKAVIDEIELGGPFEGKRYHVGPVRELVEGEGVQLVGDDLFYVQVRYMEPDIYTGELVEQQARVWIVPPDATPSHVVQICFGAALASAEHQCREFFLWKGKRVFGPHMEIDDLAGVAR